MTDQELDQLARMIVKERHKFKRKIQGTLTEDGRLTNAALLRISYIISHENYDIIYRLIKMGIVRSEDDLRCQMQESRLFDSTKGGEFGWCEPKPMSDDVLDNGRNFSYLHTTRQIPEETNA